MNKHKLRCIENNVQTVTDESFVGGKPKIPNNESIPICSFCHNELTFYFQIAFAAGTLRNKTMAVFACTSCAEEEHLIPLMVEKPKHAIIPHSFLKDYQKNFKLILFETDKGIIRDNYEEKIIFKKIELIIQNGKKSKNENQIGGMPFWLLEDETPQSYEGKKLSFLMQLKENIRFSIHKDAPQQTEPFAFFEPIEKDYYELFIGNQIYFFVTEDKVNPEIYIITQVD